MLFFSSFFRRISRDDRTSQRARSISSFAALIFCGLVGAAVLGTDRSALAQSGAPGVTPNGAIITLAPLAGSTITNRAFVTFETEGQPVRIDSNTVSSAVTGVSALALVPSTSRRAAAGAPVSLAHRLTNTGNIATAYTIQVVSLSGDSYDLSDLKIVRDANGNGAFDAGEAGVNADTPIYLNPGESADLVVRGVVPPSATPDSISRTRVVATVAGPAPGAASDGDFSPISASVVDTLTVAAGASVEVSKSASTAQAVPGAEITFTISARNTGTVSPLPQLLKVDGAPRSLVLLRDRIPANTAFLDLSAAQTSALPLYHRAGDAPDDFLSVPPAANLVDEVVIGLASLDAGTSTSLVFRVRVGAVASGPIQNTARFGGIESGTGDALSVPSNQVSIALPSRLPKIFYYTASNYAIVAGVTSMNRPLYIQAEAGASNRDSGLIESVQLTVKSRLTGDFVVVTALETGPNTGIFRVASPVPTNGGAADSADAALSVRTGDTLEAMIEESGGARAFANILVDPFGVVFDARTDAPVAGARVTLIDVSGSGNGGNAGGPARVFDVDGTTPFPATLVTGADGTFQFPLVAGSTYRLEIAPPAGYAFPSKVSVFQLPAARRIDPAGSFGGNFSIDAGVGAIQVDVPLDPPPPTGLFLQKIASRSTAEIADFVDYEIRLRNTTGSALAALSIRDTLPRGFSLVGGSVRRGGAVTPDPAGAPGQTLIFAVGNLSPGAEIRLTYRTRLGAGISSGDNRNRAIASATTPFGTVTSNTAIATVRVSAGVLTERAIIFGKVFVDSNKNRIQDKEEIGVPGVRVWIEDGTYAITDGDGKYSIYGLTARTHIVKVDGQTLPRSARLSPLTVRHGGRGDSAFADLKKAELHKVNFALTDVGAVLLAQIEKRRASGDPFSAEINPALQSDLRRTIDDVRPDPRGLPSSGTISASGPIASGATSFDTLNPRATGILNTSPNGSNAGTFDARGNVFVPGAPLTSDNSNLSRPGELESQLGKPFNALAVFDSTKNEGTANKQNDFTKNEENPPTVKGKKRRVEVINDNVVNDGVDSTKNESVNIPDTAIAAGAGGSAQFEAFVAGMNNDLAILTPQNNAILPRDQVNIRVKGLEGAALRLSVNGAAVEETRVGARLSDSTRKLQALEYVGVQLKAGENILVVTQSDGFGNARGRVQIKVSAPGRAGKIVIEAPKSASADGASAVSLVIRLVDAKGLAVTSRAPITLETASGRFDAEDLNPREPGLQLFIEGGILKVDLIAPSDPGDGLVRVLSGDLDARATISFVPALRPLIVVGTLEGGVNFFNFKPRGVAGDLFEDDLKGLFNKELGKTSVSSRAALFLKGRVLGKNLLTLRYDSQNTRDRLFRDIQPDEYYPVYGDGALKGFDAQSSGKLYVRLDRARNSFLVGDFTTASATQGNTLGNYQRSLNGARTHLENEKYKLDVFGARDNARLIVDEIRGNGTSSGYLLRAGGLQENSERVEIIVRDRNNLGSILETRPQTRFSDYEFDFDTGRILFRSPVPSSDANFNPIFVRIFYSVETGGPKFWVQGINGALKITKNLEVGGSLVRDSDPQDNFDLKTLSATFKAGEKTTVAAELASSKRDSVGRGKGSRLEIIHEGARLQARFFAGRTSADFDNPGSILSRGRGEISGRATWRLSSKTRVLAEALRTSELQNGNTRTGFQAAIEREVGRGIRAEIGVRHAKENAPVNLGGANAKPVDFTSLRARLTVPVGTKSNLFGEVESDISDTSRRVLALGGDTKIGARSRLYGRHEFISSLDGRYALSGSQEQQNTIFGIDSSYSNSGHLFSEYRLGGALSDREGQAAIGVRDAWNLADGVKVLGGFERTKSMGNGVSGSTGASNDSTAITGGLEYTRSQNVKATTRLELRRANQSNSLLGTLGAAARLNSELTLLSRGVFNVQRGQNGVGNAAQHRLQIGVSYRDKRDDRWSGLAKYEFRQTVNGTRAGAILPGANGFVGDQNGTIHLFSLDANYQPGAKLTLSGHLGAKLNSDKSNGFKSSTSAALTSARAIYELNRKTELSVQGAILTSRGGGRQTGIGAELGRLLGRDMWLSAGFNAGAVADGDLTGNGYSRRGPYLRIRFKFDESLFGSREAKLLAQTELAQGESEIPQKMKEDASGEIGTRIVEVPVIGIDAQTGQKTELPVKAEVEVALGTSAPQAVEVDTPTLAPALAPDRAAGEISIESPTQTPLNARIVEASGERWNIAFAVDAQDDGASMNRAYAQSSQARRAALIGSTNLGGATKNEGANRVVAPLNRSRIELRPRPDERIGGAAASARGGK